MRYFLLTLGCPKNVVDSEGMFQLLGQAGYTPIEHPEDADVLIVNTCGFIGPAKDESISAMQELGQVKRSDQLLIAAGCLVQRDNGALTRDVPQVDAVLSTRRWYEIVDLIGRLRNKTYGDIPDAGWTNPIDVSLPRRAVGASAYLKIADGCSAPCTFCTIPDIKGSWHSKPVEQIVCEARELIEQGVQEIILIAQDTTAYGYDRGERDALAPLIDRILEEVPELPWLRLMYAYPGRVTPRLVETMAQHRQVCNYIDIPLQHGHSDVLARMKRPSARVARSNIRRLREAMPDIAIRTGFIVGFPGETDEEFEGLLNFVAEMRFDKVGVFTYCREKDTPAGTMSDQVPEDIKEERRARLMELQQEISLQRNREFVDQELKVLIEGAGDGISVGRTYRDAPEVDGLVIVQDEWPTNVMLSARMTGAMAYDLLGEIVAEDGS
ncbi:MAG: Ribosomal protein S12 methylthiotransferase RimO [Anaerolineales bacterium]|nr:Ribosomal protein S12 methylthiotransferase RimO [Anaerolineales bacterium]